MKLTATEEIIKPTKIVLFELLPEASVGSRTVIAEGDRLLAKTPPPAPSYFLHGCD